LVLEGAVDRFQGGVEVSARGEQQAAGSGCDGGDPWAWDPFCAVLEPRDKLFSAVEVAECDHRLGMVGLPTLGSGLADMERFVDLIGDGELPIRLFEIGCGECDHAEHVSGHPFDRAVSVCLEPAENFLGGSAGVRKLAYADVDLASRPERDVEPGLLFGLLGEFACIDGETLSPVNVAGHRLDYRQVGECSASAGFVAAFAEDAEEFLEA